MPVSADTLRLLLAAGVTGEDLVKIVEAIDRDMSTASCGHSTGIPVDTMAERRRTWDRERKRRARGAAPAGDDAVAAVSGGRPVDASPPNGPPFPQTPNPPLNPPRSPSLRSDDPSVMRERELFAEQVDEAPAREKSDFPPDAFDRWWQKCPHKVGKDGAKRKFDVIRRTRRATFAELMDGLARYMATKPPDRPWCNPETWLNQGRWADQPAPDDVRGDRRHAAAPGPHRPATGGHDAIRAGFASVLGERLGADPGGMAPARRGDPVR